MALVAKLPAALETVLAGLENLNERDLQEILNNMPSNVKLVYPTLKDIISQLKGTEVTVGIKKYHTGSALHSFLETSKYIIKKVSNDGGNHTVNGKNIKINNIKLYDFVHTDLKNFPIYLDSVLKQPQRFSITENNLETLKRHVFKIKEENLKNIDISKLCKMYYIFILPLYNEYYIQFKNGDTSKTLFEKIKIGKHVYYDLNTAIYKLTYSLNKIIKYLILLQSQESLNVLERLVIPNSDPESIPEPDQLDINDKETAVNHYNNLTAFYNKYIKPYMSKYPNTEDNADIMYTRSHFYPAINKMFESLPESGGVLIPIVGKRIFGKRGVSRPLRGGLRYGRRRKN